MQWKKSQTYTSNHSYKIAPSLLCMDFLHVKEQLCIINEYADYLHVDMMDSRFVPTMGLFPGFIQAVAGAAALPIDCHLMVEEPACYISEMKNLGVSCMIPHIEAMGKEAGLILDAIHKEGMKAGAAISPSTPLEVLYPYLHKLDRVTIMTIEPGFPGAPFQWDMIDKIRETAEIRSRLGLSFEIEMDGSLADDNIEELVKAGCDVFVAGAAALFHTKLGLKDQFRYLRKKLAAYHS